HSDLFHKCSNGGISGWNPLNPLKCLPLHFNLSIDYVNLNGYSIILPLPLMRPIPLHMYTWLSKLFTTNPKYTQTLAHALKKKQSKTPSRLFNSEPPASPKTPASSTTGRDTDSGNEEELRRGIEEASAAFPCLLGKSAIIGRVDDVASESIRGSKIWLSETSMVAASLGPGSTVTVSLACPESRFSNSFPLSSIKAEYGVECESRIADEPGDYFVLATVFSSSKALKDAVRISMNLCYGLGCPVLGRTVFVYPVSKPSLSDQFNGNGGSYKHDVNQLSLLACKELSLELIPFRNILQAKNDFLSTEKLSLESSHEQNGNGNSTPKTPSNLQKLSSPRPSSPASSNLEGPVFSAKQRLSSESSIDLREVLSNESSKKLLQICATSWLYPCSLLYGNFVAVPILSEICIFCVKRANKKPPDSSNRSQAFMINRETKVNLHHTLGLASEIREKTSAQGLQFDEDDEGENMGCEISKLGGLSKEYAILRDIIVSSSTKNSLSSLGLRPTKGVLIHGPPGTGKTSLARSFARDSGVNFFSVNGPEIISQYLGESEKALDEVFRSASNAAPAVVILEVPKVNWEDVGGQKEVKNQLMEAVEWPQKHQDAFKRIGTRPPSGILMFGPPGCSKTLMARAVASEAGLNFLAVKGPELFSKWVGESEKAVRSLFAKARANAPSIIFFDEIDSLASIRGKENDGVSVSDRVMSQLLVELDGRFDRLLYVGPPNEADREAILKIHLCKIPCNIIFKYNSTNYKN
ncbi:hypothetical protein EUTSA_v10006379mg, partial [Eutrema salsugineum]